MKILIAGSKGMVGRSLVRQLRKEDKFTVIEASRDDLDFSNQDEVAKFIADNKPDSVIIAAAKVGGILANSSQPAEFIYENLMIECNLIHQSYLNNVAKLLFLGSSCIYPVNSQQPMTETSLLTGKLEPTNEPYALAKIAGIKMCVAYNKQYNTDFRAVMPTNLYGPGDNFDYENSHVIPALMRKIHDAKIKNRKEVVIWGTGKPLREFMYVDDMVEASLFVFGLDKKEYIQEISSKYSHINLGTGVEYSIKDLAKILCEVIGYKGQIVYDYDKPDGSPRKLLDIGLLKRLGWKAKIDIKEGLEMTYDWYLENSSMIRK
tara:strand:- start:7010 stop:7966 length:957 start_codon:yes stop_codon:yes gene_type:complete